MRCFISKSTKTFEFSTDINVDNFICIKNMPYWSYLLYIGFYKRGVLNKLANTWWRAQRSLISIHTWHDCTWTITNNDHFCMTWRYLFTKASGLGIEYKLLKISEVCKPRTLENPLKLLLNVFLCHHFIQRTILQWYYYYFEYAAKSIKNKTG